MNVYKIKSDIITDEEFVVAPGIIEAVSIYCDKYKNDYYMSQGNITFVERIAENALT